MNCSTFIKKLDDFIEGSVSNDLKKAMEEHIESCSNCRALYEEEKNINEMLKLTLDVEHIEFKSSRGEIMKSVDKNRYSKNPFKKMYYHFKKYSIPYTSCAALIIFLLIISPWAMKKFNPNIISGSNKQSEKPLKKAESYSLDKENKIDKKLSSAEKPTVFLDENYQFQKEKGKVPSFNTPWKNSPNGKLSVCIEGIGPYAAEEGIGSIVIKDNDKNELWRYNLINNKKQFTPKQVEWLDNENVLVIIGFGHGTVTKGGNLYILNLNSNKNYIVYDTKDPKKEIMKIEIARKDGTTEVKLPMNIYEDDNYMKSHVENLTIHDFEVIFDK